jgi:hypothetical protein
LGPGRAVLILGPIVAVMVFVVMESSVSTCRFQVLVVRKCSLGTHVQVRTHVRPRRIRVEDEGINRYRKD